jgi:uncharacterized protein (TIGR00369 family)
MKPEDYACRRLGSPEKALAAFSNRAVGLSRFSSWLEAKPTVYWDGIAELTIPLRDEITQHHGYAHGAIIGAAADNACAWAASSVVGDVVTANYTLHLLQPGLGERLRARGEVVRIGRREVICRSEVFAETLSGERPQSVRIAICTASISALTR